MWQCIRCKTRRVAEKTSRLARCPKILIVHLKRFTFDGVFKRLNNVVRVNTDYDSEGNLVFTEALDDDRVLYKLYAVINHTGRYTNGHYSSFCFHPKMKKWFKFDDSCVSLVSSPRNEIISESSYVLFFRKSRVLTTSGAESDKDRQRMTARAGGGGGGNFSDNGTEWSAETFQSKLTDDNNNNQRSIPNPNSLNPHHHHHLNISLKSSSSSSTLR